MKVNNTKFGLHRLFKITNFWRNTKENYRNKSIWYIGVKIAKTIGKKLFQKSWISISVNCALYHFHEKKIRTLILIGCLEIIYVQNQ